MLECVKIGIKNNYNDLGSTDPQGPQSGKCRVLRAVVMTNLQHFVPRLTDTRGVFLMAKICRWFSGGLKLSNNL